MGKSGVKTPTGLRGGRGGNGGLGLAAKKSTDVPGPLRLLYLDECKVHHHPRLAKVWQRRGRPLRVPAAGEDVKFVVFGALDYASGRSCGSSVRARTGPPASPFSTTWWPPSPRDRWWWSWTMSATTRGGSPRTGGWRTTTACARSGCRPTPPH